MSAQSYLGPQYRAISGTPTQSPTRLTHWQCEPTPSAEVRL